MFEYKDADFYSEFFRNHSAFELLDEFRISTEKDEKNLYIGQVEVKNTVHPLILRVEIPFTFPHNKLVFRTKSLSGYPHLIHTGKIEHGDWLCLNTPFAETVEEQLNQEIIRLKGWIARTMNPELPAIIEDSNVRKGLAITHSYEWENPDEVKEFSAKARLTFVGQDIQLLSSYRERKGYFHCVKSPDNRIYAFPHKVDGANFKLPYIIVRDFPGDTSVLEDFLRMKNFYGLNEDDINHLLPAPCFISLRRPDSYISFKYEVEYTEDEALNLLDRILAKLHKEESYLDAIEQIYIGGTHYVTEENSPKLKNVSSYHKPLLIDKIHVIRHEIMINHGVKCIPNPEKKSAREMRETYICQGFDLDEWTEERERYHHFVIGFESRDKVKWLVFFTNRRLFKEKTTEYDIKLKKIGITNAISLTIAYEIPQFILKDTFWGRGALNAKFTNKHIALVGLGAIGSLVADTLAHSGIQHIGLWDGDIVEPGNVCRSSFRLADLGQSKVEAISSKIQAINPCIKIADIKSHGFWNTLRGPNNQDYVNGEFYGNVNYNSQEESIKQLDGYDLIIDCTGSNEMLHFLSYALDGKDIVSLCITNHANELVCVTNADGNPFELRKAYLSRIEQDTKNFYAEGEGCYSPTFLAKYSDISALVNLWIKEFDKALKSNDIFHSSIFGYCETGILIDRIHTLKLKGYDIILNVPDEALLDAKEMDMLVDGNLGYVFGNYSANRKQILITHIVQAQSALEELDDAYRTSKGIIDYIGDYTYSNSESDAFTDEMRESLACKASDEDINTNNPLLALRTKSGNINFYLYINNQLVKFIE